MSATYATLAQLRAELDTRDTDTSTDEEMIRALAYCTDRIDRAIESYTFFPMLDTLLCDSTYFTDEHTMRLDKPVLEVTSLTGFDGEAKTQWNKQPSTLSAADYRLDPLNNTPALRIVWLALYDAYLDGAVFSNRTQYVYINGVVGYHSNYGTAWVSSTDTLQANINATSTTLSVNDADGADALTNSPRFSPGNLIRINSEYMAILAVNGSTNELTVKRGLYGSTAASHVATDTIDTYQVEPAINRACYRWAAQLIGERGNFAVLQVDALGGTTRFPVDMPGEVKAVLHRYPHLYNGGIGV